MNLPMKGLCFEFFFMGCFDNFFICRSDIEICKVCYFRERTILFVPCGHFVACATCASALSTCPVCRMPFKGTFRAYLS